MGFRVVLSGLAASATALTVLASASFAPATAAAVVIPAVPTTKTHDVRVGSFNLFGVNNDKSASGDQRPWRERRPVIVSQILTRHLDVVGVQEANQSSIYKSSLVDGVNQYMDLLHGLDHAGGSYALTNTNAYNCARPSSSHNCVPVDQGASGDTRILYNTDRVSLVRQGSYEYRAQTAGKSKRYLAWAVFEMKGTGRQFLFTNTHLDPYSASTRVAEWNEVIAEINDLKGSLPVIAVGDFNTSKFDSYAQQMLPAMKSNGYGDVLNQQYSESSAYGVRAKSLSRTWVNSYNGFRRDVSRYSYSTSRAKIGNDIDWVFASNELPVRGFAVVNNMDARTLQLRGVIPSDHNLVRATIVLP